MLKTPETFDTWNDTKKYLEFSAKGKNVEAGQIWLCKVGVNIGSEVSKDGDYARPILVLKTHLGGDLVSIIPLTSKFHENHAYQYIYFEQREKYGLDMPSYFLLNQVKTISIKRLIRRFNDRVIDDVYIPKIPQIQRQIIEQRIIKYMFSL